MRDTYVPIAYLEKLLYQAAAAGCRLADIFTELGLDRANVLNKKDVSSRTYGDIYRLVIHATQNEWFGMFSAGGIVPLGSFRMMGLTLMQCNDLEQAIHRAGDFSNICRGMNACYFLQRNDSLATLTLAPTRAINQTTFAQSLQQSDADAVLTSLLTWHRFSEWLIDKEIPLIEIKLSFPKSSLCTPLAYGKLDNVLFDQSDNTMSYHASYLDHPIVQNQDGLYAFLRSAPYHLVTQDPAHISPADKVRSIINRDVSRSMPSADDVAAQLNMSLTTMRRQLQKEETSFQKLKDECRMQAALHYLNYAELSNNDIAEKLGFDEPSAFFRSFKKWTGSTPGEYRNLQQPEQTLIRQ